MGQTYTVTWKNWNGTVLETDTDVPYGTSPHYGSATPTKAADDRYTYTFAGWDPERGPVEGDVTYTAVFTPVLRSYTVTFLNEDGTEIVSTAYHYGDTVTVPANPSKAENAQYSYAFSGWTPDVETTVKGNATYQATYTATVKQYAVTFKNGDTELQSGLMAYGATPS